MASALLNFASSIHILTARRSIAHSSSCTRRHGARALRLSVPLRMRTTGPGTKPRELLTDRSPSLSKYLERGMGVVVLKRGKGRFFRQQRSSMVYSGAVAAAIPPAGGVLATADPVVVVDGVHAMVGYGFFNTTSIFQVRLLRHGELEHFNVEDDIRHLLADALALRSALGFPNAETDAFRLVNGEGDRLSGLVVDVYDAHLVVSSSAAWCERYRKEIERGLAAIVPENACIIWRRSIDRLRQDGFEEAENEASGLESEDNHQPGGIVAVENGVKYTLPFRTLHSGQKTGHYTDQRDARAFLRSLLSSQVKQREHVRALDLFSYTGGFGLSAALAGASVVCVDSSARAIELGEENARLNSVGDAIQFIRSDISKFLASHSLEEQYDVVVVDPPKMAPTAKSLPRATRKYRALNASAIQRIRPGGFLLTCSCSAAVAREKGLFVDIVQKAAADVGRDVALLKSFGSAADHPVAPDAIDGDYLTACLFVCRGGRT